MYARGTVNFTDAKKMPVGDNRPMAFFSIGKSFVDSIVVCLRLKYWIIRGDDFGGGRLLLFVYDDDLVGVGVVLIVIFFVYYNRLQLCKSMFGVFCLLSLSLSTIEKKRSCGVVCPPAVCEYY